MGASVVAGVDAPPVFEFAEHVFDLVPLSVECLIVGNLDFPVYSWGDTGFDAALAQGIAEPVGIVTLVSQERLGRGQRRQQGRRTGVIADLACG